MARKPVVYVIFYSTWGHVKTLADEIVEGVKSLGDKVEVKLFRFPETLPKEVTDKLHAADFSSIPEITLEDLSKADAFMFGFPVRFGAPAAQFKTFWDSTGGKWASGELNGKYYGVFSSAGSQHGGQETAVLTSLPNFVHHGMVYVAPGFSHKNYSEISEIVGATPWGASAVAAPDGSRPVSQKEKEIAFHHGKYFAQVLSRVDFDK